MKAIHNDGVMLTDEVAAVTNMSKIQNESYSQPFACNYVKCISCDQYVKDTKWKLFTTIYWFPCIIIRLWPICQRYKMKAIHNMIEKGKYPEFAVTNMSKIQNESYSQLPITFPIVPPCCDQYVKDTKWKLFTTYLLQLLLLLLLWPICQRYKMKAIHNLYRELGCTVYAVTNMSKIQNESYSQQ